MVPSVPRLGGREDDVTVLTLSVSFNFYLLHFLFNLASNTFIPTFKLIKAIVNYCTVQEKSLLFHFILALNSFFIFGMNRR